MIDSKLYNAVNLLITTNRMHKKLIESSVSATIGLHRTQHIILMHLFAKDSLPSQKELAEHLNITPAAVTGSLKKLEAGGYIERTIGNDNRYNEIKITDLGKKAVEDSRDLFSRIDKNIFENFDENEIENLILYLEKIQNNIKNQMEVKAYYEEMDEIR